MPMEHQELRRRFAALTTAHLADACLRVPAPRAAEVLTIAETIRDTERRQAERIRAGTSLRSQVQFDAYLAQREQTPSLTFRDHLRSVGGAIEE
jgi:hypothetical protein